MKRYALVTGGSRGIGRAICIHLASMGLPIIINYRSGKEAAEETLKAVEDLGGEGELLPFDVSTQRPSKRRWPIGKRNTRTTISRFW